MDRNKLTKVKVNSGAQKNVLPLETVDKLKLNQEIEKTNAILIMYDGSRANPLEKWMLKCNCNDMTINIEFEITGIKNAVPILGLKWSRELKLIYQTVYAIVKQEIIQEYK